MPLFDWRYIKSCQIGVKQLSGYVILNLGNHLSDSHMKWYRRNVNPNHILFYWKINIRLLIFQMEKSDLVKNYVCHSASFFFRCTLAKRWCIHQPVNIYRNCLKWYLICPIILRSIAFLRKLQNEIKKKITVLKYKKTFFLRQLTKMFKLILFLGNS